MKAVSPPPRNSSDSRRKSLQRYYLQNLTRPMRRLGISLHVAPAQQTKASQRNKMADCVNRGAKTATVWHCHRGFGLAQWRSKL
jgi:hypothetical protein